MRVHPPVGSVFKITNKNIQLGKFNVPKGTIIQPLIAKANKNEHVWERCNTFNPDRYSDCDAMSKCFSDFSLISFSMGLRKCIGWKFALIEITMALARMIQKYEFELLNDEDLDPIRVAYGITFRPENLKVKITKRKNL